MHVVFDTAPLLVAYDPLSYPSFLACTSQEGSQRSASEEAGPGNKRHYATAKEREREREPASKESNMRDSHAMLCR